MLNVFYFLELVSIPTVPLLSIFLLKTFFHAVDMFVVMDVMVAFHRQHGNTGFKMDSSLEVFTAARVASHM